MLGFFFSDIEIISFIVPIVFFSVFVAVVAIIIIKSAKIAQEKSAAYEKQMQATVASRSSQYSPAQNGERTHTHVGNMVVSTADGHSHVGGDETEHYDKIVGSLGDVSDEGCLDLDGVRLIAHDIVYESGEEGRDYSEIAKAMVLGDIINAPRFKNPPHRR